MLAFFLWAEGQPAGQPGGGEMMTMMLLAFGLPFVFLVMLPARRQEKQRQAMLAALKKDDEVVAAGGIVGTVAQIKEKAVDGEDLVTLRIDDRTRITVLRSSIFKIIAPPAPAKDKEPSK
jgi:preprotein translocase subunit YajC